MLTDWPVSLFNKLYYTETLRTAEIHISSSIRASVSHACAAYVVFLASSISCNKEKY